MDKELQNSINFLDELTSIKTEQKKYYVLRDYQQKAVDIGVDHLLSGKKPAIIVMPTAAGKSLIIANIALRLNGHVLVFQPTKELLEQNYEKLLSYNQNVATSIYSASCNSKEISKITFATIGSVFRTPHLFNHFEYIIIDECFPAGSLVDSVPIENIKIGDYVNSFNHINNTIELKKVTKIYKNKLTCNLLKIKLIDDSFIICTENHPIFINKLGYIPAKYISLYLNDMLNISKNYVNVQDCRQMSLLRKSFLSKKVWSKFILLCKLWCKFSCTKKIKRERIKKMFSLRKRIYYKKRFNAKILQYYMQSKFENKTTCTSILLFLWKRFYCTRKSFIKRKNYKKILLFLRMFWPFSFNSIKKSIINTKIKRIKESCIYKNENQESLVDAWYERKNDRRNERSYFSFKRRKWTINKTSNDVAFSNRFHNGISNRNSRSKTFISICSALLQSGFRYTGSKISNRSRWCKSSITEMEILRSTKNGNFECVRVASVEIYKYGSRNQIEQMCENNNVYNIEVEKNHNYFVNNILVHNCDQGIDSYSVGMFRKFLAAIDNKKILGLTATPIRQYRNSYGNILRFITRTNPKIFHDMIYHTQIEELYNKGYLADCKYYSIKGFDRTRIRVNSTGTDYVDASLKAYYKDIKFDNSILDVAKRLINAGRKNLLIFTKFVEDSELLVRDLGDIAAVVSAKTPKKERDSIIKDFKSGKIKIIANAAILGIGFDFPELETILMARPTLSLRVWYQFIGRCIRPHIDKKESWVVDMCSNMERFPEIHNLYITKSNTDGQWCFIDKSTKKQLTNVYY